VFVLLSSQSSVIDVWSFYQRIFYLKKKVLNILTGIQKKDDVTEFITTVQLVQITINGLLKSKREFKFEALKDLQNALKEYETLLGQLKVNKQASIRWLFFFSFLSCHSRLMKE
jgi:hypothetical protein